MKKGIDYLGGVNYTNTIERHHPDGYAAGFLCKASGWKNGIKAAKVLAKTGKCPVMRLHGLWRDDHTFKEKHIEKAVKQAQKVAKLKEKYPDIKIFYSPWLEHRASQKLFRACKKACKNVLPKEIKIVCSGNPLPYGINEVHHSYRKHAKYIFSYDGEDMLDSPVSYLSIHKQAKLFFGWTPRCNGKKFLRDSTNRAKRTAWLRKKDIKAMVRGLEG